eukprot:1004512-Rhodomonas_salina.1
MRPLTALPCTAEVLPRYPERATPVLCGVWYGHSVCSYAVSGTDLAYGATRRPDHPYGRLPYLPTRIRGIFGGADKAYTRVQGRRVAYSAFLMATPRLMEPVFFVEIQRVRCRALAHTLGTDAVHTVCIGACRLSVCDLHRARAQARPRDPGNVPVKGGGVEKRNKET